jgi:hypothetical protein
MVAILGGEAPDLDAIAEAEEVAADEEEWANRELSLGNNVNLTRAIYTPPNWFVKNKAQVMCAWIYGRIKCLHQQH